MNHPKAAQGTYGNTVSLEQRLIPWEQTTPEEQVILREVERELMAAFPKVVGTLPRRRASSWAMGTMGAMASCFVALLVWWSASTQEALVPLRFAGQWNQDASPSQPSKQPSSTQKRAAQESTAAQAVSEQHLHTQDAEGSVRQGHRWRLQAKQQTRLHLLRQNNRSTEVKMAQGHIHIHVTPKSMEHFAVHCQSDLRVLVRGTVFSVEQRRDWVRVEVVRGKVLIEQGPRSFGLLSAGQGQRIDLSSGQIQRYPLPAVEASSAQKIDWFAQYAPQALFSFVLDRAEEPGISASTKDALFRRAQASLRRLAKQPNGKMYRHQVYALLLAEYRMNPPDGAAELSLLSAMQVCRTIFLDGTPCVRWYRHYLKRYAQRGMEKQQVLYWLTEALSQRGPIERQEARRLIASYLQTHSPKESYYPYFLALQKRLQ